MKGRTECVATTKCAVCQLPSYRGMRGHSNNCWGADVPILNEETRAIWFYWMKKRKRARVKGQTFTLSATEMVQLFTDAGITANDIGKKAHQYQLGRHGDTGGYEMGNCRFITMKENMEEAKRNPHNSTAIMAEGKRYESISEGSRAYGIALATGCNRIQSKNYPEWHRIG